MTTRKYVEPIHGLTLFTCPACHGLTGQTWTPIYLGEDADMDGEAALVDPTDAWRSITVDAKPKYFWHAARCQGCSNLSFWAGEDLTYPRTGAESLDEPHDALPEAARTLLTEAIGVFSISRRASAALCRASLESLLKELPLDLSMKRPTLEDRINGVQDLVNPGLWKLLTAVRHVGNKSLHGAGQEDGAVAMFLDETDDYIPRLLIGVVNQLAEQLIEIPAQTEALYAAIPVEAREAAERKAGRQLDAPPTS